jgi:DNA-binding CsgD family transcriptional regulator
MNATNDFASSACRFLVEMHAVTTMDGLVAGLLRLIAPLGLNAAACGVVSGPKAAAGVPFYFAAWPQEWAAYYVAHDLMLTDPLVRWARNSGQAITFHDLFALLSPRDVGRETIAAAARFGFTEGIAAPMRSADNSLGLVTMAGKRDGLSALERDILAAVAHAVFCAAERLEGVATGRPAPIFTRREIECLNLLAHGHADGEIGKLLGLTTRTIRFHLANAREKAGAESRTHLAALALSQGWISM